MVDREILAINKIAEYNKSITDKYDFFLNEPHYININYVKGIIKL